MRSWDVSPCSSPLSCFDSFWMLLVFYVGHRSSCLLPNKSKCSNITKSQPRWTSFAGYFPCQQSVWTTEGLKLNIKGWKFRSNTLTWRNFMSTAEIMWYRCRNRSLLTSKRLRNYSNDWIDPVHAIIELNLLKISLKSFWTLAADRVRH